MKSDRISSVKEVCSSIHQLLHTCISAVEESLLPWPRVCSHVRCDHSLGSSTLTKAEFGLMTNQVSCRIAQHQPLLTLHPCHKYSGGNICPTLSASQQYFCTQFCAGLCVSCEGSIFSPNTHFPYQGNRKPMGHTSIEHIYPNFTLGSAKNLKLMRYIKRAV